MLSKALQIGELFIWPILRFNNNHCKDSIKFISSYIAMDKTTKNTILAATMTFWLVWWWSLYAFKAYIQSRFESIHSTLWEINDNLVEAGNNFVQANANFTETHKSIWMLQNGIVQKTHETLDAFKN